MDYIEFNGKYYALDLEKCMKFASNTPDYELQKDNTKTETYGLLDDGKDFKLLQRENMETTSNKNPNYGSARFTLLTTLIQYLMTVIADANGTPVIVKEPDDMHFGQMLTFNTLLHEGILIEITNDDDEE